MLEKNPQKNKLDYETEHIKNPCISTLAVNPKEYLKIFEDKKINKKHKGIKKGSQDLVLKISATG